MLLKKHVFYANHDFSGKQSGANRLPHAQYVGTGERGLAGALQRQLAWQQNPLDNICCDIYCRDMVGRKQNELGRQANVEEKAFVELLHTTDRLSRAIAAVLKTEELSPTQYNVLRVLRGAPDGLPCGEIGRRLITREPDITRLLDRMEKRGLISRCRQTEDRRTVLTRITKAGLTTVNRLEEPVQAIHRQQLGHLSRERLQTLTGLLREARQRA